MEHQTLGFRGSVERSLTPPVTPIRPTPSHPFYMHKSHIRTVIVRKRRADIESLLLDLPSNHGAGCSEWVPWLQHRDPLTLIQQDSDSSCRTKQGLWGPRGSRISLRELSIIARNAGEKSSATLLRDMNKSCATHFCLYICVWIVACLEQSRSSWYGTRGKRGARYFWVLMQEEKTREDRKRQRSGVVRGLRKDWWPRGVHLFVV